ncbi:MAG TPA: thioredoxin family protein [Haliangium sp.]|nr:thioredoxin family protein [Haliangium sp.]
MSKRSLALAVALPILLLPALAMAAEGAGVFEEQLARGWVWAHLAAFGFGFLTSLTPCVYPMIPIVVAVFGARDEGVTRQKAFFLATAYVLGMGAMYASLGIVFGLIGKQFGSILANPWVVLPIVGVYLAMAASMFGAFELNLPASWQSKLNQVGGKGYGGAFGMGLVGGLTAAPCTGPFLIGILGYVASTRNVAAGGSLLFIYALGMGVLFLVVGAFAASLPKSGRWMEGVKSFGGVALLGVSLYFLRPILPALGKFGGPDIETLVGAVALLAVGVALGAIHRSFHEAWAVRMRKALGVIAMTAGIGVGLNGVLIVKLPWVYDEAAAFAQAKAEGKGVMIDFAANWCAPCIELEHTFASSEVYDELARNYVFLKFDVSKGTDEDEARQEKWNAETLPAVVFADAAGNELGRVDKYLDAEDFLQVMRPAVAKLRGSAPQAAATPAAARPAASEAVTAGAAASEAVTAEAEAGADESVSLTWRTDEQAAFAEAQRTGKSLIVDFHSTWCTSCADMDDKTWSEPEVVSVVEEAFVPLRIDVTQGDTTSEALQEKYHAESLPTLIVVDATGKEHGRIVGAVEPAAVIGLLTTCPC